MVENPGMETHIHPFQLYQARDKKLTPFYLHSSPEFHMKNLLASSEEFQNIFTINYCFRDEPTSPIHRPQFLMLEWYRKNAFYTEIMDDVEGLIKYIQKNLDTKNKIEKFQRVTIQDLIQEKSGFDILNFLDKKDLKEKIQKDFKEVPLPDAECAWDDYYFLFFLNIIEPLLINYPYLLLYEFPAPLSALSTLKPENPKVCERFEVYLKGIELCNCFNELTDFEEQKKRFEFQANEKKELYGYELPWPEEFMQTLKTGYPRSSGIALGIERLLYSMFDIQNPFFK